MNLESYIRTIPDFPKPGIQFKDITPLLKDAQALDAALTQLAKPYLGQKIDKIVGIESRGFIFAVPLAQRLNAGFVPIRKPGKLPHQTISATYELEYGTDQMMIHTDSIEPGQRVLIVDDLLASGGTMSAAIELIEQLKGTIVGLSFVIELKFLGGRQKLTGYPIHSLVSYS